MEEIFPKENGWGQAGVGGEIGQYLQSEVSCPHWPEWNSGIHVAVCYSVFDHDKPYYKLQFVNVI